MQTLKRLKGLIFILTFLHKTIPLSLFFTMRCFFVHQYKIIFSDLLKNIFDYTVLCLQ